MNFRTDCKYDLATVSSLGVRITPANRQPVHVSSLYEMHATSAETNVLNIGASLGMNTLVLTRFVKDSGISRYIKGELRKRNIAYMGKDVEQGGPWGYRHQFNIVDCGYGGRGPRAENDRAGEIGRTITAEDYDVEQLFGKDGVRAFHLSGLIAALSPESTKACLELARAAKEYGTRISFDLNFRASFWKNREDELRASFREIASLADVLIGNEEDFQLCLGIEGPEAGGKDISGKISAFQEMIRRVQQEFPNVSVYATTLREVLNANEHSWGAILLVGDEWFIEQPRAIQVYDRVGGGDGYVGGFMYGLLKGWNPEKAMQFGWATGALAATMSTDYATPVDEEQVWSIYQGNARVKR